MSSFNGGVMGPTELFPIEEKVNLRPLDRIDYGGMLGTVTHVDDSELWESEFPVTAKFDAGYEMRLTRDGRQFKHQKHGLIKVIGKAKPKETFWKWVCKEHGRGTYFIGEVYLNESFKDRYGRSYDDLAVTYLQKIEDSAKEFEV